MLTGVFYPPRQGSYMLKVAATDLGYPPRRSEIEAEVKGCLLFRSNFYSAASGH